MTPPNRVCRARQHAYVVAARAAAAAAHRQVQGPTAAADRPASADQHRTAAVAAPELITSAPLTPSVPAPSICRLTLPLVLF